MLTLSLLIPTLPERYDLLKRLQKVLAPQLEYFIDRTQIIYNDQGRGVCIGEKRNQLVQQVTTDYLVFIDDDDMVSSYYLSEVFKAMDQAPDVITFNGWMTTNGANRKNFVIKLGEKYEERNNIYYRHPNHLCPIKSHLCRRVPFPHQTSGEDYSYSLGLKNRCILKTSVHIEQDLYHYDFRTNKPPYGKSIGVR